MGIFSNCLLASDIDGTLAESARTNPENLKMIDYFCSEGGIFTLATGRSIGNLKPVEPVLSGMRLYCPIVVADGCMIYDYGTKKTVYEAEIPKKDYSVADFVLSLDMNVGIEIYSKENVYTVNRTKNTTYHQELEQFVSEDRELCDVSALKWSKVMYICQSADDRVKLKGILESLESGCAFTDAAGDHGGEILYYLEQKPKGVTKASTLKLFCEKNGIKKGGFFAIGDYINDIEMLESADISASPEFSAEIVKQCSDYITVPCKDGAVADFIKYLKTKV